MTRIKFLTQFHLLISGMTVPGGGKNRSTKSSDPKIPRDRDASNSVHRYRHDKRSDESRQKFAGLYTGPYFDPAMPNNVSVQLDDTALLICKVNQVGRKTVSFFVLSMEFWHCLHTIYFQTQSFYRVGT